MNRAFIWKNALDYLSQRTDLNLVREYMTCPKKPKSFSEIYKRLLDSLKNKRNMSKSIGKMKDLESVFFGFDHKKVLENYSSWQNLLQVIKGDSVDAENLHNYWVIFCKGSISSAHWLNQFSAPEDFFKYVDDFDQSINTRPALPLVIEKDIFGYGFALACDFLKELGFCNYSKPDVHLIDIFSGLELSSPAPLDIFRAVDTMAKEVDETPYAVDKVFWLIGSGNFYNHVGNNFLTDKQEFVRLVKEKWQSNL